MASWDCRASLAMTAFLSLRGAQFSVIARSVCDVAICLRHGHIADLGVDQDLQRRICAVVVDVVSRSSNRRG